MFQKLLDAALDRLVVQGSLTVRHADGMLRRYSGRPGPEAAMRIADAGATEMARVLRQSVAERGRCVIALSGRPGAVAVCRALADPARGGDLPWEAVWVFATDQRVAETPESRAASPILVSLASRWRSPVEAIR